MTEADFALLGIDSETILYVWTWGFGSIVFAWWLGYAIGIVKVAVRKL